MKQLKELKQTAIDAQVEYQQACNIELIGFIKTVTDIYKYRLQIVNVDSKGASGIVWHDDKLEPTIILAKIADIARSIDSECHCYINYENIVKFSITY